MHSAAKREQAMLTGWLNCWRMQELVSEVAARAYDGSRSTTRMRPLKPGSVARNQAAAAPCIAPPTITTS